MTAENESRSIPRDAQRSELPNEEHAQGGEPRRDEETAAIQQPSRHQHIGIEKPPEVPPATPRKALTIVGVLLLVLLLAGGITLWDHVTHERALAKETERETVPTVAVI